MSKRLQVVVGDDELERYIQTADASGLTVSEWVRQSLRAAERDISSGNIETKLQAIRQAASYSFPVPDVDSLLAEMETERTAEIEAALRADA